MREMGHGGKISIGWEGGQRHHCGGCGKVVCDSCSMHQRVLVMGKKEVRLCDVCKDDEARWASDTKGVSGAGTHDAHTRGGNKKKKARRNSLADALR